MINLAIITATRAEYGLLYPVIKQFRNSESCSFRLELIVTGTHLSEKYGYTLHEIEKDGLRIDHKIPISVQSTSAMDISKNMADTIVKFTELFIKNEYSAIMILGDRYEMLSIAIAATNTSIPIYHLCGGDTTEGAVDECFRHSITKMSYLHFVSNEISEKRVIQLGEQSERVFNVGSTSIDNILNIQFLSKTEVLNSIKLIDCGYALCTYHPVTLESEDVSKQIYQFLDAIKQFKNIEFIITKSNADLGGALVNSILDKETEYIANLHVYASLGIIRYLSLMKHCKFVLGNSSSGIIEAPAFKVPTINIGNRQRGRLQCQSIINSKTDTTSIVEAIEKAMSVQFRKDCEDVVSPYGDGRTSKKIVEHTSEFLEKNKIDLKKKFYDI